MPHAQYDVDGVTILRTWPTKRERRELANKYIKLGPTDMYLLHRTHDESCKSARRAERIMARKRWGLPI